MIHDLELTTVVDAQGVLTPVFSESDNELLDESIDMIEQSLVNTLYQTFEQFPYQSDRLAIIDVVKRLNANDDMVKAFIKKYEDEL